MTGCQRPLVCLIPTTSYNLHLGRNEHLYHGQVNWQHNGRPKNLVAHFVEAATTEINGLVAIV